MTELLWPLLGGLMTAALAGPLGALLLWRRMAYFGDSLAHASLLGVALALLLELPSGPWVVAVCLSVALLLSRLMQSQAHGIDTWLTIMAYSGLSLALLLTAVHGNDGHGHGHDLEAYLFGDLMALTASQCGWTALGLAGVAAVLWRIWPALLAMAVDEETAAVDGWPVQRLRPVMLLLLAGVVAAGAKLMGVLLISALLVMPAAAARLASRTPGGMALGASLIAMLAVLAGWTSHVWLATPPAPVIVLSALAVLLALMLRQRLSA